MAKGWKRKEINEKNKLRELLDAGKPTIGTHMITTSSQIVEIIGHSGVFDWRIYSLGVASTKGL